MVLIIGATGFIGMYTTQAFLKAGKQVIATGRNAALGRKTGRNGSGISSVGYNKKEEFDKLPKGGVEGVVLLAGLLPANAAVNLDMDENAADYFEVNVIGTIHVLEYCRKMVFVK